MNCVSGRPEFPKPGRKATARQGRLEREADPLASQFTQAGEHHTPGGDRHTVRIERREAASDHVRIDELIDGKSPVQKRRRSRRLPGAIRAGQDHDAGTWVAQGFVPSGDARRASPEWLASRSSEGPWTARRRGWAAMAGSLRLRRERRLAERVGFEPTCRLPDKTLSRRPRYDHFGTSPGRVRSLIITGGPFRAGP